jgi:hypothetical protein
MLEMAHGRPPTAGAGVVDVVMRVVHEAAPTLDARQGDAHTYSDVCLGLLCPGLRVYLGLL